MTKPAKKIYANKNDSCATIVHKVLSSGPDEFILYLPKGAIIAETPKNFKLLKREASAVGKKMIIESVDSEILQMASAAGFETMDGLFNRSSSSKVSLMDIMPVKSKVESLTENDRELKEKEIKRDDFNVLVESEAQKGVRGESVEEKTEYIEEAPRSKSVLKRIGFSAIFIAIIAVIWYLGFFILPSAEISVERKKADWSFSGTVIASTSSVNISGKNLTIPAQIFIVSKNGIYSFPASGSETVQKKATGKIIIYNAYSSEKQPLVKNTRFVTPEGKVYRITSAVTVPGAKISEGKIQASSVEAEVIADAPGESYNTGPVAKLRVPGFQGSPKYDGFYGEFKTDISGGFVGEMKVPTKEDIESAKSEVATKVDASLKAAIAMTIPPEFKIIEDAISYRTVKEGVTSDADEKGEFSYGMIIEAKVPAYKESDLIALMEEKFKEDNIDPYDLISKELSYSSEPIANFSAGRISIPIEFSGKWARSFDSEAFRAGILGASEESLKSAIFAIPGVLGAKADLWPFWVTSVPKNPDKIEININ